MPSLPSKLDTQAKGSSNISNVFSSFSAIHFLYIRSVRHTPLLIRLEGAWYIQTMDKLVNLYAIPAIKA